MIFVVVTTIIETICKKLLLGQGFGTSFVIHGIRMMKEKRLNNTYMFLLKTQIRICLVGIKEVCHVMKKNSRCSRRTISIFSIFKQFNFFFGTFNLIF